jgi:hypothetical protein
MGDGSGRFRFCNPYKDLPMKLIGAALPRTGTMSLYTAFKRLDVRCYHMKELMLNSVG